MHQMQSPSSVVVGLRFRLRASWFGSAEHAWQESGRGTLAMRYVFFSLEPCFRVRALAAMQA